ncbi:MAG: hypothetical protein MI862_01950 [Desulfobacterales bacterium]|nr:hypothetical protein [Desulfobacterales bacterium]
MTNTIFSATGCARCNITKRYMKENDISYEEFDIRAEGKTEFSKFYRENRKNIFRDKDGVEFPVFTDGVVIRQGVSVVLGYLVAKDKLTGFIKRSELHGEWLDGIDISGGDPGHKEDLIKVVSHLKQNGLKIQAKTSGKNSVVLEALIKKNLVDKVIMEVKGPVSLYPTLLESPVEEEDIKRSIKLTCTSPEYSFFTTIVPYKSRTDNKVNFISSEEVAEAAKLIEEESQSKKQPYTLHSFDPEACKDEHLSSVEPLPSSALFKYRSAARRHQVMTEIGKK